MIIWPYALDSERCEVRVIETDDDLHEALSFLRNSEKFSVAFDTETTGLDLFSSTFRVRTVQLGDCYTAYVLRMRSVRDRWAKRLLELAMERGVILHNASFDLVACDVTGLMPLTSSQDNFHDTKILAHLLDPRGKMDGGTGFKLKDLSAKYVDPTAPDTQNDLKEEFRKIGATLKDGWARIDINNPTYLLYAGLDVLLTARLHKRLRAMVNREGFGGLAKFEHNVQKVTTRMKRRGFRIDVDYTHVLQERLTRQHEQGVVACQEMGLENINAPKQVASALLARGWEPTEFTKSGNAKVDKAVLETILSIDPEDVAAYRVNRADEEDAWYPDLSFRQHKQNVTETQVLASNIMLAKRASKWRKAYAEAMLDARDAWDHVHPDINALQARTARMSIGNPPLQQLPSRGDDAWLIRRQVIADYGYVIGSADYDQVEFRVLAALANISRMKYAIANGIDLHDYTAELLYGPNFTKHQRSIGKGVGFGKVFGGGAKTLARQTGAPIDQVRTAIASYDEAYFELPAFARALQREQRSRGGYILNYHGRYLPLDVGREYAAVNYSVQSIARDILAQALLDLAAAGFDDYLLLPVHDEVLFQAPEREAEEVARAVGETMSGTFIDVPISASGELYGKSWANGYVFKDAQGVVRSKGTKNPIEGWVEAA